MYTKLPIYINRKIKGYYEVARKNTIIISENKVSKKKHKKRKTMLNILNDGKLFFYYYLTVLSFVVEHTYIYL